MHEGICSTCYKTINDTECLLNYFCENNIIMKFFIDKEIIQEVISISANDDHDPNNNGYNLVDVSIMKI